MTPAGESVIYWKRQGNCRVHSWFVLIPQQILRWKNPDAPLNKRGEKNVKCISIFSEALYYSSKLLFCVTGVTSHICFVRDPRNNEKTQIKNNPQTYPASVGGQEFPFGCRCCNSCHDSRSTRGKKFTDDFQTHSRNAIRPMLAQAHAITLRKSSFTYWRSLNVHLIWETCSAWHEGLPKGMCCNTAARSLELMWNLHVGNSQKGCKQTDVC